MHEKEKKRGVGKMEGAAKKRYLHVADIEPLVDRRVNGCSGLGRGSGDALDDRAVSSDLVGTIDRDVGANKNKQKED